MKTGLVVVIALLASVRPATAEVMRCSVRPLRQNPEGYFWPADSIAGFVAQATIIVRVRAEDSVSWTHADDLAHRGNAGVLFRVLESLRGRLPADSLILPGTLVGHDDFNTGVLPYRMTRRAGQRGDCFAREYRRGAEYLLLLRSTDVGPSPHWAPLAPLNEQVRGTSDPWVAWVRARIPR
jgi:hypothetical protein